MIKIFFYGDQGIEQLKIRKYSLILLDVNMPGIDGYETAKRIKNDEALIETNDGFELEFNLKELIKVESKTDLKSNLFKSAMVASNTKSLSASFSFTLYSFLG